MNLLVWFLYCLVMLVTALGFHAITKNGEDHGLAWFLFLLNGIFWAIVFYWLDFIF